jgi:CheY-like chemotaxis protein
MWKKRRILCVDDHDDTCGLIATILRDHEIVSAHSKSEGLRRATSEQFDLYLLDYHLPDGTGLELCLLIRNFDSATPILFVTGTFGLTNRQVTAAGAQGLVNKCDLTSSLISAISKLLTG